MASPKRGAAGKPTRGEHRAGRQDARAAAGRATFSQETQASLVTNHHPPLYWVLGLVLLEMARRVLSGGVAHQGLVLSLREPFPDGRNQRLILFVADRSQCESLAQGRG